MISQEEVKKSVIDYTSSTASNGYFWMVCSSSKRDRMQTARIIGNDLGKTVYLVNYQSLSNKYEEKAEKNLKKFFRKADRNDWILFFDEADSIFGKRTEIADGEDKYVSRDEDGNLVGFPGFQGLVIFGTSNNYCPENDPKLKAVNYIINPQ